MFCTGIFYFFKLSKFPGIIAFLVIISVFFCLIVGSDFFGTLVKYEQQRHLPLLNHFGNIGVQGVQTR